MYKVMIYKDSWTGFWCARKQYDIGKWSVPYMFSWCSENLRYKLIEDGEEEENIYIGNQDELKNNEVNNG